MATSAAVAEGAPAGPDRQLLRIAWVLILGVLPPIFDTT